MNPVELSRCKFYPFHLPKRLQSGAEALSDGVVFRPLLHCRKIADGQIRLP